MFDFLKEKMGFGKKDIEVVSPVEGNVVPLAEVNDPIFSEKVIGDGIAIKPAIGRIVSPVNGKIDTMFETGHAVSLNSDDGAQILIHVGLDTVKLKGQFYKSFVQSGDNVNKGDVLIAFDVHEIEKAGYDPVTVIIICNTDDYESLDFCPDAYVKEQDNLINLKNKTKGA